MLLLYMTKNSDIYELLVATAKKHEIDVDIVKHVYLSIWGLINKVIRELPDLRDLSIEEIDQLDTDFHIANFGRFYIDLKKVETKRKLGKLF